MQIDKRKPCPKWFFRLWQFGWINDLSLKINTETCLYPNCIPAYYTNRKQNRAQTGENSQGDDSLSSSSPASTFDDQNDNDSQTMNWSTTRGYERNHRWERTSLPAPQAHVRVTQRKWVASPAAFRDRLRGAYALSLAPGEVTQVGG